MAVSRHLGFYRTANSAIRSADPENPSLEPPNMSGSDVTVCEIFAFKHTTMTLKVGFGVTEGHRKWHYSIEHVRLCSKYTSVYYRFQDSRILVENIGSRFNKAETVKHRKTFVCDCVKGDRSNYKRATSVRHQSGQQRLSRTWRLK